MSDKSLPPQMMRDLATQWIEAHIASHKALRGPEEILGFARWLDKFLAGGYEKEDSE